MEAGSDPKEGGEAAGTRRGGGQDYQEKCGYASKLNATCDVNAVDCIANHVDLKQACQTHKLKTTQSRIVKSKYGKRCKRNSSKAKKFQAKSF